MGDRTSREVAWLRAIEAPAFRRDADAAPQARRSGVCVEDAREAVSRSRQLLDATRPAAADWTRYIGP